MISSSYFSWQARASAQQHAAAGAVLTDLPHAHEIHDLADVGRLRFLSGTPAFFSGADLFLGKWRNYDVIGQRHPGSDVARFIRYIAAQDNAAGVSNAL